MIYSLNYLLYALSSLCAKEIKSLSEETRGEKNLILRFLLRICLTFAFKIFVSV